MKFLIKCDNIKVIKTNRNENKLDVYVDNNPGWFLFIISIPIFGFLCFIIYLIFRYNRRKGECLLDTTNQK